MRRWSETVIPNVIAIDHPRYLAFIPHAPTQASVFIDLFVSAASIYGGSWMEASGAVVAENQALAWLAGLAGYPEGAGGTFVPGGTLGNLAALHTAREAARERRGDDRPARWQVAVSNESHSSVIQALRVMDMDPIPVPVDAHFRLTADALKRMLEDRQPDGLCAVVASAGSTNAGAIDDLAGIAEVCAELGVWLHVDGAYGLAALASERRRSAFHGIERSDSFIVDPHKWLFGPYDSCALLYRDPALARRAHSQSADYLDVINERNDWNPADYAVQLSRRARGLPIVVFAGRAWDGCLWGGRRSGAGVDGGDGRGDPAATGAGAGGGAGFERAALPANWLERRRLSELVECADRVGHGVRGAEPGAWNIGCAHGLAESAHDIRGCRDGAGFDAVGRQPIWASDLEVLQVGAVGVSETEVGHAGFGHDAQRGGVGGIGEADQPGTIEMRESVVRSDPRVSSVA